jgi:hypothetical protein
MALGTHPGTLGAGRVLEEMQTLKNVMINMW